MQSRPEDPSPEDQRLIVQYSERALHAMLSLKVTPSPRNYTVFYAYASGQPTGLVEEINDHTKKNQPFDEGFLEHLYDNYIALAQTRVLHDTAQGTRKVIGAMLRDIHQFSGATQLAEQEIDDHLQRLNANELVGEELRNIAAAVVRGAQNMQESSATVNDQLTQAQQEISALRSNLAKATTESERDFLTGSYNRKAFDRMLNEALEEAQSEDHALSFIMIDIDHFKKFNDTYGHLIGDEVLKYTARSIFDTVKGRDLVARFGGEEFAVILPHTPIGGGMVVAEAIRKNIGSKDLKRKSTGEQFGNVTISLGVASYRPGDTAYHLIKRADEALYRAKREGRDRVGKENPE